MNYEIRINDKSGAMEVRRVLIRRNSICGKIIEYGILGLIIFSPLPAASVAEWSTSDYIPSEIVEYSGTKRLALEKPKAMGSEDILGALNSTDWNIAKTSRLLGISRPTLYKKISHYNLTRSKQDPNVKAVSQPVVEGT